MTLHDLLDDARRLDGDLTDLRHRIHRQPETGLQLPRTQEKVLAALSGLDLHVTTGATLTSVTAVLRGEAPSPAPTRPVVLLRGDMDALPLVEHPQASPRSEIDGAMHACGHDLHTSMLVGAAHLLAARRAELAGDVVLMFQPGEEGYDGAALMLEEGVLTAAGPKPVAAYALHVLSNNEVSGAVRTRPGPLMAASDGLFVTVRGRGGHGSAPHQAKDPVPATCEMVLALQAAFSREKDPFAPAVLTVGSIHAGTRRNIIPAEATFEATVRTFDEAVRQRLSAVAVRVCEGVAAAYGLEVDVRYEREYPVTVNSEAETLEALAAAGELLGEDVPAVWENPLTGSEDFSRVPERAGRDALPRCVPARPRPCDGAGQPLPRGRLRRRRARRRCSPVRRAGAAPPGALTRRQS